jgi:hypothetical protein
MRPGRDADPSPLLVPRSKKQSSAIPLLSLRAFMACKSGETYLPSISTYVICLPLVYEVCIAGDPMPLPVMKTVLLVIFYPEDGNRPFLRNSDTYVLNYKVSCHGRS